MFEYVYQKDLVVGVNGFPKIAKSTLAKARKNKELEWVKIGREIVYRKEWVQRWLESNIRPAKTLQENE